MQNKMQFSEGKKKIDINLKICNLPVVLGSKVK